MSNVSKLTAEALGTFALCFIGAGSICLAQAQGGGYAGLLGIALAHGVVLSIAVSATMNISGGHINPAVTIAMLATKRISAALAIQYILAQLAGATIGGIVVLFFFRDYPNTDSGAIVSAVALGTPFFDELSPAMAIFIEAMLTFMLVFAIFGTAVDPRAPKIGGFGIGLMVMVDILVGGPLTGAAMNPARTFGPGVVANLSGYMSKFWGQQVVYWVGPILGALVAAFFYDRLLMEKKKA